MNPEKKHLQKGMLVEVRVDKTEDRTQGFIADFAGGSASKGVRVRLVNGQFGYVERIVPKSEHELATAKFYIKLMQLPHLYYISDKQGIWVWERKVQGDVQATSFMFTSEQAAKDFLAKQKLTHQVKRFSMKKTIASFLSAKSPTVIFIDGNRKIKREHLEEQERMYRMKMGL